jgi:hypothetical protein
VIDRRGRCGVGHDHPYRGPAKVDGLGVTWAERLHWVGVRSAQWRGAAFILVTLSAASAQVQLVVVRGQLERSERQSDEALAGWRDANAQLARLSSPLSGLPNPRFDMISTREANASSGRAECAGQVLPECRTRSGQRLCWDGTDWLPLEQDAGACP